MPNDKQLSAMEKQKVLKILENYGFDVKRIKLRRNTIANTNNVFVVFDGQNKFILRESAPQKSLEHLKLEVEVISYLNRKNFKLTPHIIKNKTGGAITAHNKRFYILQNFMPGQTKASWNNLTRFSEAKLVNFFATSARFTKAVSDFKTKQKFANQPIYYYAKRGQVLFSSLLKNMPNTEVKRLLSGNQNFINKFIQKTQLELNQANYDSLPKQLVHFDFHPGNVHFLGDKVSGIFDFDWVRFDSRITDLAGTIGQSCYRYKGVNRARYNKGRISIGLKAYRKGYGKSEFSLEQENQLIKIALKAYMFYMLLWTMNWYLQNLKEKKALDWMQFPIETLKLNDFDYLFS